MSDKETSSGLINSKGVLETSPYGVQHRVEQVCKSTGCTPDKVVIRKSKSLILSKVDLVYLKENKVTIDE